jgi:MinD superfamily P-loop ATPase
VIKEITILSGKGGTGKTSITAALASIVRNAVFCDNDVDAADLHLIFKPVIKEKFSFSSGSKSLIDTTRCTNCGLCSNYCRFDAIKINSSGFPEVNHYKCEGCRLCQRVCPAEAITLIESDNNHWFISETRFGPLVHAKMGPGEENSGKLVTKIRQKAKDIASETKADFVINDGPPGIGCSAIASVTGSDAVLLVIEPTLSGLHDAIRLIELVKSFHIPVFALINKFDINVKISKKVKIYLSENSIPLLGELPFDVNIVNAMIEEKNIVEYAPDEKITSMLFSAWIKMNSLLIK